MPDQPLRPLDPAEEAAWRDLAKFFLTAPRLLDEDLQRGADISLSEYTTLMSLSEAPDHRLRITELANRVYLSGSRTTRLVDELAASGLIRKTRSPADARGINVTLTSNSPSQLLLSNTNTGAGSPSITVNVPSGMNVQSFYLQSVANSGVPTYNASAPGFASRTGSVTSKVSLFRRASVPPCFTPFKPRSSTLNTVASINELSVGCARNSASGARPRFEKYSAPARKSMLRLMAQKTASPTVFPRIEDRLTLGMKIPLCRGVFCTGWVA